MAPTTQSNDIQEAEATYTKAAKAELSKNYNQAYQLYIKATQSYLHLSRTRVHEKEKWNANAEKALQRAEKIKSFVERVKRKGGIESGSLGPDANSHSASTVLTPVGIDHFSSQEQGYVLSKGSRVNGLTFNAWDAPLSLLETICEGEDQPELSPEQQKVSPVWREPAESGLSDPTPGEKVPCLLPQDIIQHVVTDCSVCASISVCLEHTRRFGSDLVKSILRKVERPTVYKHSVNEFHVRLMFNGAWRRIIIDDKLPYNPQDDSLMCMSVRLPANGDEITRYCALWPSLIEKGYMKLMGGYDFPGSNTSIDLHAITGWIPEHIGIRNTNFEREKTWKRILEGFHQGRCLISLGTGPNPNIAWRNFKLLESHSYAVLDATEDESWRGLTVLDSWINTAEDEESKVLRMPWNDVLDIFDGIYLNWDPASWNSSRIFNGMWRKSSSDEPSCNHHLRLNFENDSKVEDAEIWVLLTRHVSDTHRTTDFISLRIQVHDELLASAQILSNQNTLTHRGTFTNGAHSLSKIRIPPSLGSGSLSIFASYDGPATEIGFTMTAYAPQGIAINWDERVTRPPFTDKATGTFTTKNSGGNCAYPSFMLNPQYHLRIHARAAVPNSRPSPSASRGITNPTKATVSLILQANKDMPVNLAVAWSQGDRLTELAEQDIVMSSGPYTYGLARSTKELAHGDYTVVLSTFEPNQTGPFSLRLESSLPCNLTPIPQEGAGMYSRIVRGKWEGASAGGSPSSKKYHQNPMYNLKVASRTQAKFRLQLVNRSVSTQINLTVYPAGSSTGIGKAIATTGAYSDAICGVATPQIGLNPGNYLVVPSTYSPGFEATFQILVYSSISGVELTERK